jgi:hypothetical protein
MSPQDDNLMDRFDENARRFKARDAIVAIVVAAFVLAAIQGASMRTTGEQLNHGVQRDVVLAVAKPAGWLAHRTSLHTVSSRLRRQLSPDADLTGSGGFASLSTSVTAGTVPQVTPDAFAPSAIGAPAPKSRSLHTLLVTGDSLSTPLDLTLARRLAGKGVRVLRDVHLGSGISKTDLVDWGKLSATQVRKDHPDAVVVFIGANEGFPMDGPAGSPVQCCSAAWAAIYANRARQMMNTYRRGGASHVYWITVPTPREASHARIERVVNAAIAVAAQPWRSQVDVIDSVPVFAPGGKYRDAMTVGGRRQIVRESDGIHLNQTGSGLLAGIVLNDLQQAFSY